jgi:tetratricopeptide (TPR) repeat protein
MQWTHNSDTPWNSLFEELALAAVARFPERAGGWIALGGGLLKSGKFREAADYLAEAASRNPEAKEVHILRAKALFELHEDKAALQSLGAALDLAPDDREARILRAKYLSTSNDMATREAALAERALLDPTPLKLLEKYNHASQVLGQSDELLSFCNSLLRRGVCHTPATFYRALALARMGRSAEACKVIALNRFVEISELSSPQGYRDATIFRETLAKEIRESSTLVPDPRGRATRDGFQTRNLLEANVPAVHCLIEQIKAAVNTYASRLAGDSSHFAASQPSAAKIQAWAVVSGTKGHQQVHWHPSGWLSGVFYVKAPRAGRRYCGTLLLGALDPEVDGIEPPWGTIEVEPVPGRLVLFPSYIPHATLPTKAESERIVVAFDVTPSENPG